MRTLTVSLLLGLSLLLEFGWTVSAVSLSIRPNLQQIYSKNTVYLHCEGGGQVERRTTERQKDNVQSLFGRLTGQCGNHLFSSCYISSPSDSGQYWCETSDGQRSEQVNITVFSSDRPLILEIPALPVMTGSEVTFRCRTKDGPTPAMYLFRNGVHVRDKAAAEQLTLSQVQRSDEGFYSCFTDKLGSSPESWLRVKDPSPTNAPPTFHSVPPTILSAPPPSLLPVSTDPSPTNAPPTFHSVPPTILSAPPPSLLPVSTDPSPTNVNTSPSFPSTPPTSTITTPTFHYTLHFPFVPPIFTSAPPPSLLPVSFALRLLCHLVVISVFCISSFLMVLRCRSRKTGRKLTVEECNDITGDVTTEHNF